MLPPVYIDQTKLTFPAWLSRVTKLPLPNIDIRELYSIKVAAMNAQALLLVAVVLHVSEWFKTKAIQYITLSVNATDRVLMTKSVGIPSISR